MNLRDRQILLVAPEIVNMRSMPCVGLGYIGAYLAEIGGRDVRIIDSQFTKEDPLPVLRDAAPTLVAIGVDSRTVERGLAIARYAKRYGHTTMLGGLHVSLVKEQMLDYPEVDYAIVGDGEIPTLQLVEALEGRRAFGDVSGLAFRRPDGSRQANPNTTEEDDLDSLPFPDYRLAGIDNFPLYPLVTSRDCPFKCTYCTVGNISHGRFRHRSPESCVEEILLAKERYGVRGFLVVDENFSVDLPRALSFVELLVERQVGLPWSAFEGMRADCLCKNPAILDLLLESNCRWIFFGVESAENAVLKTVLKGQKFDLIDTAAGLVRQKGMKVGGFFIVGLPDSNFERDMTSIHWADESLDGATFWMSIPYLNTGLYRWVRENARLLREPVGDNLVNSLDTQPFYDTDQYPAAEIKRAHVIGNLRTGATYHLDYMDRRAYRRLRSSRRGWSAKRRLVRTVARHDPSFLPRVVEGREFAPIADPVHLAVEQARARAAGEPLPYDLARAVSRELQASPAAR